MTHRSSFNFQALNEIAINARMGNEAAELDFVESIVFSPLPLNFKWEASHRPEHRERTERRMIHARSGHQTARIRR